MRPVSVFRDVTGDTTIACGITARLHLPQRLLPVFTVCAVLVVYLAVNLICHNKTES